MILLDSNVIINSTKPGYGILRRFLVDHPHCVSVISRIEVLGFHRLTRQDKSDFEKLFSLTPVLPFAEIVTEEAIRLRQLRKMSIGDAIIAATALVNNLELATSNTRDFKWIESLKLIDPFNE